MINLGIYLDTEGKHGGMHQYAHALLGALLLFPADKYRITAVCMTDNWAEYCVKLGIKTYRPINSLSKGSIFSFMKSYVRHVVTDSDLLDCKINGLDYMFFPSVSPNSVSLKIPAVCAIHDLMHRYEKRFPEVASIYEYLLREVLFGKIAHKSKLILTDSQMGKHHVEECYFHNILRDNIKVLPYIAPDYIYSNDTDGQTKAWEEIKPQLPNRYFFYPAQFWKHKNHIHLVMAIEMLKKKYPDINIVFVGSEKNASNSIKKYIREHELENNVTILGYVSDDAMIQLYRHAVALFMASYLGPTNIPQLEAFYLGCPVAVAAVYGVPEQVGNAALLFAPDDTEKIAIEMEQLWTDNNLRLQLIDKGKKKAEGWGIQQFSHKLLEYVDEMTSKEEKE
jgi:glycosyltransferase involved in cell wall biosynthesis